jgi:hypothetical protein
MTRRERIARKIEKRTNWAESRKQDSVRRFDTAHAAVAGIPLGQPILVGHHSERHHRADLERHDRSMRAAIESQEMAQHHKSVAVSLQNALDTSIFSDDRDAVEALEARIAEREAESERMRFINKAHAKYIKTGKLDAGLTPAETAQIQNYKPAHSWEPHPYAPFQLSNLRERITADKKRLETIKMRNARTERAKNSGGVVIEKSADGARCQVSFAEKPAREILNDLRGADFHFSGGSWFGITSKLPQSVVELCAAPEVKGPQE